MKFSLLCQRYLFSLKKRLLLNYGSSWEGFQRFCQISNLMGGYVSVAGLCLFYEWRMKFMFVVNKNQDYQIEEKKSSKNTEIVYVWGSICVRHHMGSWRSQKMEKKKKIFIDLFWIAPVWAKNCWKGSPGEKDPWCHLKPSPMHCEKPMRS